MDSALADVETDEVTGTWKRAELIIQPRDEGLFSHMTVNIGLEAHGLDQLHPHPD